MRLVSLSQCVGVLRLTSAMVLFITSGVAVPIPTAVEEGPSNLLNNINRNYEIVEGPKEFLLPLAPIKSLLARHERKSEDKDGTVSGNVSDLDYMVYGKVYLMKALGISNRSIKKSGESLPTSTDKQVSTTSDPILFPPTTKSAKRPYQYKYWNTPKPSDYKDFASGFTASSEYRKLDVRSAERDEPVSSSSSPESDTAPPSSVPPPTPGPENQFTGLDEEALELLRKLMPEALTDRESSGISNQNQQQTNDENDYGDAIPGNNSTNNGNGSIELDNRFLINVPQKSNTTPCPEGQRRTHRGACKPVFVHHASPYDGIFAGRLTAPKMGAVASTSNGSENERRNGGFQLSSLFSSFIKLEKSLERAVKEAEQKLGQVTQKVETKDATDAGQSDTDGKQV